MLNVIQNNALMNGLSLSQYGVTSHSTQNRSSWGWTFLDLMI